MADDTRTTRRDARSAIALTVLVLAVGAVACAKHPVVDPPPGAEVKVTFFQPQGIAVSPDTVLTVSAMSGLLVALRGDTVVVRVARLTGPAHPTAWAGREVAFARDRRTKIEQTSFDGSAVGKATLIGMAWVFVVLFRTIRY